MKLGIGSFTYPWAVGIVGHAPPRALTAFDLIERAFELSVRVVQIGDNLPLDRLSIREQEALAAAARGARIDLEAGTRGIEPAHLRGYLDIALRLGSPILRVVVDTADRHPSPDEVVATLRGLLPDFERARVCLAIENHDRFPARALARIIAELGSAWVGVCLDTVNSFGALEGPEAVVEALAPWTVNLHLKDFDISRAPSQLGFTISGRPAGQGRLDIPWLLSRLRRAGRDPNAIVELWTPMSDDLERTVALETQWALESISYLRTLVPE